ncbi:hypothetical protein V8B55DRAFT_1572325 [Mucor lusitanicus]
MLRLNSSAFTALIFVLMLFRSPVVVECLHLTFPIWMMAVELVFYIVVNELPGQLALAAFVATVVLLVYFFRVTRVIALCLQGVSPFDEATYAAIDERCFCAYRAPYSYGYSVDSDVAAFPPSRAASASVMLSDEVRVLSSCIADSGADECSSFVVVASRGTLGSFAADSSAVGFERSGGEGNNCDFGGAACKRAKTRFAAAMVCNVCGGLVLQAVARAGIVFSASCVVYLYLFLLLSLLVVLVLVIDASAGVLAADVFASPFSSVDVSAGYLASLPQVAMLDILAPPPVTLVGTGHPPAVPPSVTTATAVLIEREENGSFSSSVSITVTDLVVFLTQPIGTATTTTTTTAFTTSTTTTLVAFSASAGTTMAARRVAVPHAPSRCCADATIADTSTTTLAAFTVATSIATSTISTAPSTKRISDESNRSAALEDCLTNHPFAILSLETNKDFVAVGFTDEEFNDLVNALNLELDCE